jgi:hypothetical protein
MTRDRIARILTAAALGIVLLLVWIRRGSVVPAAAEVAQTPQDTIYKMLEAARSGNVRAYLSHYADPMASDLRQTIREKTESGFRDYLISFDSAIKGVAVMDPGSTNGDGISVRVEYIYPDRNEAQLMHLVKQGSEWKIAQVETTERAKTLVPYGTPVE